MAKKVNRTGEVGFNNQGCKMTILCWRSTRNIDIQFEDGTILYNKQYGLFKRKSLENPNFPSLFGKGYMGIGKYASVDEYGNKTKSYVTWYNMFKRCYNEKYGTYIDVEVCDEWVCFQNFAPWFYKNCKEGWDLDKDILCEDCREYSPENCAFVPHPINSLFMKNTTRKDKSLPSGVYKSKNKFRADYRTDKNRNDGYLGLYSTIEEAEFKVNEAKENHIKKLIEVYKKELDSRVYEKLKNLKLNK